MRHESRNCDFLQAVQIGDGDFVVIMMAKAKQEIRSPCCSHQTSW